VVVNGCAALALIVRKEHRLSMCENGALRRIFGPKRFEVIGTNKNNLRGL
jgi:hypothetical protein